LFTARDALFRGNYLADGKILAWGEGDQARYYASAGVPTPFLAWLRASARRWWRAMPAVEKSELAFRNSGEKSRGVVLFPFALCVLDEEQGFFQGAVAGGFALGAEGAQFDHGALGGAPGAPVIEGEELEVVSLEDPGLSIGDSFAHDHLGRVFVLRAGGMAGAAASAAYAPTP
jgi:hypothetical protein